MRRTAVILAGLGLLVAAGAAPADDFKPEEGYTSLFNGQDLTGWRYKGSKESLEGKTETADGRIKVANGAIVMMEKDNKGKGGIIRDLYTVKDFDKPFHLKLEFRAALRADSGVYVRGPQLQVRDFIRRDEQKHMKKFRNDDWNELDVVVKNNVVTTTVNGRVLDDTDTLEVIVKGGKPEVRLNGKAIDARDVAVRTGAVAVCTCNGERLETMRTIPARGGIGLQAEAGKFEFRHIRVKELE
jgi:Domain of Unknown Function (DUF1080)